MPERPTFGVFCPNCRTHNARLTDPNQRDNPVLIYACERCGHLWTRRMPDDGEHGEDPPREP